MAIGFFKKLKNGWRKFSKGVQKAAKWVNNKVIKPVAKPILNTVADFVPGGQLIKGGVDAVSNLIDGGEQNVNEAFDWARQNIPVRTRKR